MTRVALVVVVIALVSVQAAAAEIVPGHLDESIAEAYPIQPFTPYAGAFDDTYYDDVDYLAFNVSTPGKALEFTVANTTGACNDPDGTDCPVYATVIDQTDNQVGGPDSAAGTIATAQDTEVFDWTFAAPGTYYLLIESNGDESPGSPSYTAGYSVLSPRGAGGGPGAPLIRSLRVAAYQRGDVVTGTVTLGQDALTLRATLRSATNSTVRTLKRGPLGAGAHRFRLVLPRKWRQSLDRHHTLAVAVQITVRGATGTAQIGRSVTLVG